MRSTRKSVCLILALCMVLSFVLGACTSRRNTANNTNNEANTVEPDPTPVVPEDPNNPTITVKFKEITAAYAKSKGYWEFLANMFPNYAIYSVPGEGYVAEPADPALPLNVYDWSQYESALGGIDVSKFQGTIDWTQVKASGMVNFAFMRVGYRGYGDGTARIVKDERFDYNARSANSAGIPVGVYFVTKAINEAEAREEAEWVISQIKGFNVTWPIVMDFEPASGLEDRTYFLKPSDRSAIINAFSEVVRNAGYTPMTYGNIGTYMTGIDLSMVTDCPKWFAQYFNQPHFPYEYQIWQATDSGSIPGISGNVDIDYSMYDYGSGTHVLEPVQPVQPSTDANTNTGK